MAIMAYQSLGDILTLIFQILRYIWGIYSTDPFSFLNTLFLAIKIFCLVIEMIVLFMLLKFTKFIGRRKIRNLNAEDKRLKFKHYIYFFWIAALIFINFIFSVTKCFMKTIIMLTTSDSTYIYGENQQFVIESTIDVINGISVLFIFYNVGKLNHKRK